MLVGLRVEVEGEMGVHGEVKGGFKVRRKGAEGGKGGGGREETMKVIRRLDGRDEVN